MHQSEAKIRSIYDTFPNLIPGYGGLREDFLQDDSKNYLAHQRVALRDRLLSGDTGIEIAREYTIAHHFLFLRWSQEPSIELLNPDGSVHRLLSPEEFLAENRLALALRGGSASGTMCPWSDVDAIILQRDEDYDPKSEDYDEQTHPKDRMHIAQGLSQLNTLLIDACYKSGISDFGCIMKRPQEIALDLGLQSNIPVENVLHNVTSLFHTHFLCGSQETYDIVMGSFFNQVKEHTSEVYDWLIENTHNRHVSLGYSAASKNFNVKNSPGGLRDIETVEWLERLSATHMKKGESLLSGDEHQELLNAKSFFLAVKYLLHANPEITRREVARKAENNIDEQVIAKALAPLTPHGAPLDDGRTFLKLFYQHTQRVSHLLSHAIDRYDIKRKSEHSTETQTTISAEDFIHELADVCKHETPLHDGQSALILTTGLRKIIAKGRVAAEHLKLEFEKNPHVREAFLQYIDDPVSAPLFLRALHHLELLGVLLPSFLTIEHFSEIDTYVQQTLDQHSIDAVSKACDFLLGKESDLSQHVSEFAPAVKVRNLTLALLLHDVARPLETQQDEHPALGKRLVKPDLQRLCLHEEDIKEICALIGHHSLIPKLAYDSVTIGEQPAEDELSYGENFLKQLFVLSWADKSTSNSDTWEQYKLRWMLDTYESLKQLISPHRDVAEQALEILANRNDTSHVMEHAKKLPEHYCRELPPEVVITHADMAEKICRSEHDISFNWLVGENEFCSFDNPGELLIVAKNFPGCFARIAATLHDCGYDIIEAKIYTRNDNLACNSLLVRPRRNFAPLDYDMRQKALGLFSRNYERLDAKDLAPQKKIKLPGIGSVHMSVDILTFDDLPQTEVHIRCDNFEGLAYTIAKHISALGMDIEKAKLRTGNSSVRNIFTLSHTDSLHAENLCTLKHNLLSEISGTGQHFT